ncbi:MAG: cation-translocating P-type ATPase [Oscillospiraceae bacterium]|nr:cation-translocating P-type ATPase [Oscillospiraceae bacterium]
MPTGILEKDYDLPQRSKQDDHDKLHGTSGLSQAQAERLLEQYGENIIQEDKKTRPLKIFAGQFKDLMVMILLAAAGISAFIGEPADAVTIIIIVMLNAILGFIQEYRTERTLQALKNMTAPSAKVCRDGHLTIIPAALVVPGDILSLEAGDKAAADAVILQAKGLSADESVLTGESEPVSKAVGSRSDTDNSIGKKNIIYSGTIITKGTAQARVIATGKNTQMGKISGMIEEIEEPLTPLQKRLGELGRVVAIICLAVCVIVSGAGIIRGEPVFDMLMTGITIAIAAIPEGLPATVTIALALAVGRMLKQNALVHKLHSVETLGCTSVICTDKTGTVTENKMTVCRGFAGGHELKFSGQGYKTGGHISVKGESAGANANTTVTKMTSTPLREMLRCAVLCNNGDICPNESGSEWNVMGDPTETALLIAAAKGGMNCRAERKAFIRTDEIPFDSESRSMTVTVKKPDGSGTVSYIKGSVEVIIDKCKNILTDLGVRPITYADKRQIADICDNMASGALRVLAFAYSENGDSKNLTFAGVMGMSDPPREEAKRAVRLCREAKIRTVMITGDHKNTAAAVARQAGILLTDSEDAVLTGAELANMSDEELKRAAPKVCVYARVSPGDKLRIVRAYKSLGHIVTMTGDGVNDSPAVKEADIGVAMGITGTDVTRQAADMVLLDDNFATLVNAVEQGRGIYANIRKFVRYLLSCNIGEVLTMFLGIIMGMPMVLLPSQILLVNLVTDGLPAVALGVEPCGRESMKKPPRRSDESFFAGGLLFRIVIRGVLIGICTLAAFTVMTNMGGSVEAARTGALLTLVMSQLFHVFECKSEEKNIFTVPYFNNPKLLLAVLISAAVIFGAVYLPFMQTIFDTVPLSGQQLMICLGLAFLAPLIQCFVKC